MKLAVLGCGNWGSVFGSIMHRRGHRVKIWEFDRGRSIRVQETRDNAPFLTGHLLPPDITVDADLGNVVHDAELIVLAVPCQTLPSVLQTLRECHSECRNYLSLIKGIDAATLKRPSQLLAEALGPRPRIFVLSGPSIANEIIRGEPAAVVLAGVDPAAVRTLREELALPSLRIYAGQDIVGVELGGALKNVVALACGMSDGLGFGSNAKGALITRGIVEMQRLGVALGARCETFWGLSGIGDLVTTSFSFESRNHRLGVLLGQGKTLDTAQREIIMVAEGVPTTQAAYRLASEVRVDMPIVRVVYEVLYGRQPLREALRTLMERPLRDE